MVVREMLFLLTIKSPYQNDEEIFILNLKSWVLLIMIKIITLYLLYGVMIYIFVRNGFL
jgi:hypothetical protein